MCRCSVVHAHPHSQLHFSCHGKEPATVHRPPATRSLDSKCPPHAAAGAAGAAGAAAAAAWTCRSSSIAHFVPSVAQQSTRGTYSSGAGIFGLHPFFEKDSPADGCNNDHLYFRRCSFLRTRTTLGYELNFSLLRWYSYDLPRSVRH